MSEHIDVTELGEIVARCIEGAAWTEPHPAGHVWLHVEDEANAWIVASALVSRGRLAAWCRRVLREVDPDPVPTVDEVMEAWGIDDLRIHTSRNGDCVSSVWLDSEQVGCRNTNLTSAGCEIPRAHGRYGGMIGHGPTHADAFRNAFANAAGPWGDLP